MKLVKLTLAFTAAGLVFSTASYLAASQLEEGKKYSFPENLGRHFASSAGGQMEFGDAKRFDQTVEIANGSVNLAEIEIETTARSVELSKSTTGKIEIAYITTAQNEKPLIVDSSRGQVLRIMTEESETNSFQQGWMVFNFDDSPKPRRQNVLQVQLPPEITAAQVRTVSGRLRIASVADAPALKRLHFQSKSGDIKVQHSESVATDPSLPPVAESMIVETVSGDYRGSSRFKKIKFNSVSGDLRLTELLNPEEIESVTVSGDVRIQSRNPFNMTVSFDSKSGDMKIMADAVESKATKSRRGGEVATVLGNGFTKLSATSVSGDVKIHQASREADEDGEEAETN